MTTTCNINATPDFRHRVGHAAVGKGWLLAVLLGLLSTSCTGRAGAQAHGAAAAGLPPASQSNSQPDLKLRSQSNQPAIPMLSDTVISWLPTGAADATTMVRFDPRWGSDPAWSTLTKTRELAKLPQGRRVMLLFQLASTDAGHEVIRSSDIPGTLAANGFTADAQAYCQKVFTLQKKFGIQPDLILLDYESGIELWRVDTRPGQKWKELVQSVLTDRVAAQRVPPAIKAIPLDAYTRWDPRIQRWNDWALTVRADMLRQAVTDVATSVFGTPIPVSNYADCAYGSAHIATNLNPQWYSTGNNLTGSVASPSLYLTPYPVEGSPNPQRWNNLILRLNEVRATINEIGPDRTIPWISQPGYQGDNEPMVDPWLWQQLLTHLHAMGIRHYLYFNPLSSPPTAAERAQDAAALAFIRQLEKEPVQKMPEGGWPLLSFKSTEIHTGSVVTRVTDYRQ